MIILMYHHVKPGNDQLTVTTGNFRRQLLYLMQKQYKFLSGSDVAHFVRTGRKLPKKSAVITFDDGWIDNYQYAVPILREMGAKATWFVVTDWVERSSSAIDRTSVDVSHEQSMEMVRTGSYNGLIMTWVMLNDIVQSGIGEVHPHSHTHLDFQKASIQIAHNELRVSKRLVESRLGAESSLLCWPYGSYSNRDTALAKETGFIAAFTTRKGSVVRYTSAWTIPRLVATNNILVFKITVMVYQLPAVNRVLDVLRILRSVLRAISNRIIEQK